MNSRSWFERLNNIGRTRPQSLRKLQKQWLQHLTELLSHQTEAQRQLLSRTQIPPGVFVLPSLACGLVLGMRRCLLRLCIPGWDGDQRRWEGVRQQAVSSCSPAPSSNISFFRAVPLGYAELQEREHLLYLLSSFYKRQAGEKWWWFYAACLKDSMHALRMGEAIAIETGDPEEKASRASVS